MRIGIVGKNWGKNYARILNGRQISHWIAGREWEDYSRPDGLIIASSSDSHYEIAVKALANGIPVLIEKPVAMKALEARNLVTLGGIALVSHTRLYDPLWPEFKASARGAEVVEAWAGGVTESNPDAFMNWAIHLAAMCFDLGCDPFKARFNITGDRQALKFVADGHWFMDSHGALDNLVTQFLLAIERGEPNNEGVRLGLKTLEFVEKVNESRKLHGNPRNPCGLAA